jgi:hypothetical protein
MLVGLAILLAKLSKIVRTILTKKSVTSGAVHGYQPNRGNFKTHTHTYKHI